MESCEECKKDVNEVAYYQGKYSYKYSILGILSVCIRCYLKLAHADGNLPIFNNDETSTSDATPKKMSIQCGYRYMYTEPETKEDARCRKAQDSKIMHIRKATLLGYKDFVEKGLNLKYYGRNQLSDDCLEYLENIEKINEEDDRVLWGEYWKGREIFSPYEVDRFTAEMPDLLRRNGHLYTHPIDKISFRHKV